MACVMINNSAVYKPVSFRSDGTVAVLWPYFQGKQKTKQKKGIEISLCIPAVD